VAFKTTDVRPIDAVAMTGAVTLPRRQRSAKDSPARDRAVHTSRMARLDWIREPVAIRDSSVR